VTTEQIPGRSAGNHRRIVDKLTLHSTEGSSIAGAVAAYRAKDGWPHKTIDYRGGRRDAAVHLPLTVAARTLRNGDDPGETNRAGTIQYELVGSAGRILEQYDEADWIALGRDHVGPDCRAMGVPLIVPIPFHPYPPDGGHRLGREPWRIVTERSGHRGIVGHQHWADDNSHGDPGDLTKKHYRGDTVSAMDLIFEGAGVLPHRPTTPAPTPEPTQEADTMAKPYTLRGHGPTVDGVSSGQVWLIDPNAVTRHRPKGITSEVWRDRLNALYWTGVAVNMEHPTVPCSYIAAFRKV